MATAVEEAVFVPSGDCVCGGRKRKCECTHSPNSDPQSDSDEGDYVTEEIVNSDDDDDDKEYRRQLRLYLQQVRESKGFHVDTYPLITGGIHPLEIKSTDLYKKIRMFTDMAIEHYNEKQKEILEFVDFVKVNSELVRGSRYYITFVAKDSSGETRNYQALVWNGIWEKEVELCRPEPIKQGDPKKSRLLVPHGV